MFSENSKTSQPFTLKEILRCFSCKEELSNPWYKDFEVKSPEGNKFYVCAVCTWSFANAKILKLHIQKHTHDKELRCVDCLCNIPKTAGKMVDNDDNTPEVRTQIAPCLQCDKLFSNTDALRKHEKIHDEAKCYTQLSVSSGQEAVKPKQIEAKQQYSSKHLRNVKAKQEKHASSSDTTMFNAKSVKVMSIMGKKYGTRSRKTNLMHGLENVVKKEQCVICGSRFSRLKRHIRFHMQNAEQRCPKCNQLFNTLNELKAHCEMQHTSPTKSENDNAELPSSGSSTQDENTTLKIEENEQKLISGDQLQSEPGENMDENNNNEFLQFVQKELLSGQKSDVRQETSNRQIEKVDLTCSLVSNETNTEIILQMMKPGEGHVCTVCSKVFKSVIALQDHTRTHASDKPYQCSMCGAQFSEIINLHKHIKGHTMDKHHKCNTCGKGFRHTTSLYIHSKIHVNVASYLKESKPQIKKIFQPERPKVEITRSFQCRICNMMFSTRSIAKVHVTSHLENDKSYQCPICSKIFLNTLDLKHHIQSHVQNNNFNLTRKSYQVDG